MKKAKILNLMCLSMILVFSLIIGVNMSVKVNAETANAGTETTETAETTFEMVYGASVRISEGQVNGKDMTNGLRFQVKMDETTAKSINGETKKLYVLIAPATIVDLTSDAQIAENKSLIEGYKDKWISVAADSIYESVDENGKNYYFANAMICNLTSDFYGVKFNAVAIIDENGEYTYAKAYSATRSIYDVVNSAVLDVYADKIIGSEVAENTKLDYAKWYGTAEYPVAPKTPAQFNKYNELKSTTLKNLSVERQDVMVNNPVVTIGGTKYDITVPEDHGEQDVEVTVEGATVTVPVTIIDDVLTAENIKENIQSKNEVLNKGKYFILNGDIDASQIDWTSTAAWDNGFEGTIDGRGYTVKNLNIESTGIFNHTNSAKIKKINFTVSSFTPTLNQSVFGVVTEDTLFENISITFNCTFTATTGGILSGNNAVRNTYKDIQIIAEDGEINTLSQSSFNSKFENVTVEAMKMNYVYNEISSVDGVTFKKINVVTLTNNQDILLTNETYAISLGSEGTGLTINSITCNGVDLGTNLSNLDMSAIKDDMTKHGITNVIVKGEKDGNKVTIIAPVTLVTKMISNLDELRNITRNVTDKNANAIFGYYKLANDIDCAEDWAGFTNNNESFSQDNSKNGFRATLDGNGYTLSGFVNAAGLFRVIGEDAVIKNVNFESTRWAANNPPRLFGAACYNATFENVNIVMKSTDGSKVPDAPNLLFGDHCKNNTFKDVTLKVYSDGGSTLADLNTVFGNDFTGNICEGVKIYCKSVAELGKDSQSTPVTTHKGIEIYTTEE